MKGGSRQWDGYGVYSDDRFCGGLDEWYLNSALNRSTCTDGTDGVWI